MLQKERLTLIGAPPSPYTRKMIALLRYRRIPYEIIWGNPGELLTKFNSEQEEPLFPSTYEVSTMLDKYDGQVYEEGDEYIYWPN